MTQRPKQPTISDVANHAGVSPMTVSRVLNSENKVKAATKERVLNAIKALNYEPNISARALAGKRNYNIGLIYTEPSGFYWSELLVGILEGLSHVGHQLRVHKLPRKLQKKDLEAFDNFVKRRVDGLIVPPPLSDERRLRDILIDEDKPYILLSGLNARGQSKRVCIDDYAAAKAITKHLIGLGHKRIAHISGDMEQYSSNERVRGYKEALTEAGIALDDKLIRGGDFSYLSGQVASRALLEEGNRPSAIFAANDDMAAASIAVAMANGLSVPLDVSIAGFDDSPLAQALSPKLTTVQQPITDMAGQAVDSLLKLLIGKEGDDQKILMPHKLVIRESTAAPEETR